MELLRDREALHLSIHAYDLVLSGGRSHTLRVRANGSPGKAMTLISYTFSGISR